MTLPSLKATNMQETGEYPVRITKYLALQGITTRRAADGLVKEGLVKINGKAAVPGQWIEKGDVVTVSELVKKEYVYYLYHKPVGVVTHSPQEGEVEVVQAVRAKGVRERVFPVGRLDKASSGLLLITNDGRITDRLLNPANEHEKEYIVETKEPLSPRFARLMERGVDIEGYRTKPCTVQQKGECVCSIVLHEGKKHQVRRMVAALHHQVKSLKRIRIMGLRLGTMKSGDVRPLRDKEREQLLSQLGLGVRTKESKRSTL
jgi:23S rRNA pseudouridine2604 synthase